MCLSTLFIYKTIIKRLSTAYSLYIMLIMNDKYPWKEDINPREALILQKRIAADLIKYGKIPSAEYIAGIDISVSRNSNIGQAAVVILKYPELEITEIRKACGEITFPYIPGLLSFREIPLILKVWQKLTILPDIIMVDGQGYAHPRRIGIASHLGILLDIPAIGCAKSRLCGEYQIPSEEPGSYTDLLDDGEIIGAALRTKNKTKPLFISIGHKISLENAICWVMQCCRGYRLPQPTRLAHLAAGNNL
jgi:deoxyribonuclease V